GVQTCALPICQVPPVGVDVLAEESHLDHAFGGESFDLRDDVAGTTRHFGTPHRRHDAEGARVVTADLDRHPSRVRLLATHGEHGRHRLELVDDLGDASPFLGVIHQV